MASHDLEMEPDRRPTPAQVRAHQRYCSICAAPDAALRAINEMLIKHAKPGQVLEFAATQQLTRCSYETIAKHRAYLPYILVNEGPLEVDAVRLLPSIRLEERKDELMKRVEETVEAKLEAIENIASELWYSLAVLNQEIQKRAETASTQDLVKATEVLGKMALLIAGKPTDIKGKVDGTGHATDLNGAQDELEAALRHLREKREVRVLDPDAVNVRDVVPLGESMLETPRAN